MAQNTPYAWEQRPEYIRACQTIVPPGSAVAYCKLVLAEELASIVLTVLRSASSSRRRRWRRYKLSIRVSKRPRQLYETPLTFSQRQTMWSENNLPDVSVSLYARCTFADGSVRSSTSFYPIETGRSSGASRCMRREMPTAM